jgi:hypothetical protein
VWLWVGQMLQKRVLLLLGRAECLCAAALGGFAKDCLPLASSSAKLCVQCCSMASCAWCAFRCACLSLQPQCVLGSSVLAASTQTRLPACIESSPKNLIFAVLLLFDITRRQHKQIDGRRVLARCCVRRKHLSQGP